MYLKIMNEADQPDCAFTIIEANRIQFQRGLDRGWACVDGEMVALTGHAYILNERGRTIDSFSFIPARAG